MPWHVVAQGECLASLAARYGFESWRTIYFHEANSEFREQRPNPNILFPGDRVFVPEPDLKALTVPTGRTHRFKLNRPRAKLIVVLRAMGEPLANRACDVELKRGVESLTTDGEGRLEIPIGPADARVRVHVEGFDDVLVLVAGHLDPITEASGVQARLFALGFSRSAPDGRMGPVTRRALRHFQISAGLKGSGELDVDTRRAIEDAYGD